MHYTPGRLLLAVGPRGFVMLPASPGARAFTESVLLPALSSPEETDWTTSGPLGAYESYAVVLLDGDSARLLRRGEDVTVQAGGRLVEASGAGPVDVTVSATGLTAGHPQQVAGAGAEVEWYALHAGVVLAGLVRNGPTTTSPVTAAPVAVASAAAPPTAARGITREFVLGTVPEPEVDPAVPAERDETTDRLIRARQLDETLPPSVETDGPAREPDPVPVEASPATPTGGPSGEPAPVASAMPAMPDGWVSRRVPRRPPAVPSSPQPAPGSRPAFLGRPAPVVPAPVVPAPVVPEPLPEPEPVSEPVPEPLPEPAPTAQPAVSVARRWDAGLTVLAGELPAMPESSGPAADPVEVQAVTCPKGHLGPPEAPACRVCGRAVVDRTVTSVRRPQVGRLCREGAPDLPLTGQVVFGRQPEWLASGEQSLLIALDDPEQSISRSHLVVAVDGWAVSVTDLGGRNGTVVQLPTGRRQQLTPHRPLVIAPSTVITLADVVSLRFEVP